MLKRTLIVVEGITCEIIISFKLELVAKMKQICNKKTLNVTTVLTRAIILLSTFAAFYFTYHTG